MRAVCWNGTKDVRVEEVGDPEVINPRDAILRITSTAICGSDLHLYNGYVPAMQKGDILGHEFMGEIVEVGERIQSLNVGDRVVASFGIACGFCFFCKKGLTSLCDNSNPNAATAEKLYGFSAAGLFGYSHIYGGYSGGQAEYVRVPFADFGTIKVAPELGDEQVLFLSDILPTAYMAAENCSIQRGDTIAIWGCGPVGQLAIRCAYMLGANRVIAIESVPERLTMAREYGKAEVLDYKGTDIVEELKELTGGRGPDACIDAVGMEAHGSKIDALYDYAKQAVRLETDRPHVLREAIQACRKGGTISIPGVYGGVIDKVPFGAAFAKGLTLRLGQTNVQKYMSLLLQAIQRRDIDPTLIITHRMSLEEAPMAYDIFNKKAQGCIKVVLKP
ncbi:MAG: glutathione-dependent formaldehyde dehydrogenase [Acidobacteria bacterium]|nr:MAG: glutathione-dependent formaldehyde dehydrogenase [Acidobacteriota bacterium]